MINMMKLFLLSVLLSTATLCMADILGVSLDGSQPYISIQSAVDASAHGDTVLVYPGRYIENVDYNGKNITISSLELTSGNPAFRDSTIIDGNHNGSVIKSVIPTSNAGIYGFTLTNGSGSNLTYFQGVQINLGGGIAVHDALLFHVSNCIIENNIAYWGGGIWIYQSTVHAKDTIIRDNFASDGGGLYLSFQSSVVFDQVNRCSIYNNTSGGVQDIVASESRLFSNIYLNIGTVCPTANYYILFRKSSPDDPGGFPVIDIQQGYRTDINHDLYVSPLGDDENDGLSTGAPLRSIYRALQLVASDSLNQKTVYLAGGNYSSADGQYYPICLKPYVRLIGSLNTPSVLMNMHYRETISGSRSDNIVIENLVIDYCNSTNGSVAITLSLSQNTHLRNIKLLQHQSCSWKGISLGSNGYVPASFTLENVTIEGQVSPYSSGLLVNTADADIKGLVINNCHTIGDDLDNPYSLFYFHGNKLSLSNTVISNNSINHTEDPLVSIGAAHLNSDSRLIMNNVLIANNQSGGYTPVFIAAFTDSTSVISNCTFANNSGGSIANILNGNLRVANCIFDNDTQMEILCQGTYPNSVSHVSFENNFIRGYPNTFSSSAVNEINFNDVVLTGNPGFCSSLADDPLSYRLSNTSICRDAGTPDTAGLYLPEYDLYGNPRVYGTAIDIGCNEWSYPVAIDDQLVPPAMPVSIYPNPFMGETSIRYHLDKTSPVSVKVYNLRGQLVRTLYTGTQGKGEQHLAWEGCDDRGKPVASGIYFLQLSLEGKALSPVKMVKW